MAKESYVNKIRHFQNDCFLFLYFFCVEFLMTHHMYLLQNKLNK